MNRPVLDNGTPARRRMAGRQASVHRRRLDHPLPPDTGQAALL